MAFINYVTQIQFEFGAVQLLRQECDRVGITRPLIVTDPGVKAAGVLQKALDALPGLPLAVFWRVVAFILVCQAAFCKLCCSSVGVAS